MRFGIVLVLLLGLMATLAPVQSSPGKTSEKVPGALFQDFEPAGHFIVKFQEHAAVRFDGSRLVSRAGHDLRPFLQVLEQCPAARIERLFLRSEPDLDAERRLAEARSGQRMPDLNSYVMITFQERVDWPGLVDAMNALSIVAAAYPDARGQEPGMLVLPPALLATPDFTPSQGYRDPPPTGVNASYGNRFPDGKGQSIQVIDFERGWNHTHEDLGSPRHLYGALRAGSRDHGTAVLGEMIGQENGFGVTGIAPAATALTVSYYNDTIPNALNQAIAASKAGDFIILESQLPTMSTVIPIEWEQATFDVVKIATGKGIHVFAAAGNGSQNLDDAKFLGRFDRNVRDSGAVMCAASNGSVLDPASFSNYGSRIDAHGWGYYVISSGYGTLYKGPSENEWYTNSFSGTSSATPMVTASGMVIEAVSRALRGHGLKPPELRDLITQTGTPQNPNVRRIGPRPDLKRALSRVGAHLSSDGLAWPGRKVPLDLVDIDSAGLPYQAAASFGTQPGIVLPDQRIIPLNPDPVFYLSALGITNLFQGFSGWFDNQGYASATLEVLDETYMVGITLHVGFVVIDFQAPSSVRTIANPWAVRVTAKA